MVVVEQPHSPNGGSEIKYRARPNRLWGRPKGPSGGPGPHLSSPILPRFRPERRKSLFWPSGAGTPPVGQKKSAKKAPKPNQRQGWLGWGCPRGPGDCRGHRPSWVCSSRPCTTWSPLAMPPNTAIRRLWAERPHTEGQEFRHSALPELTAPMDLPGGCWVGLRRRRLEM